VRFERRRVLGARHRAGGRPTQRHRSIAPTLHVATDATHGPHHVLDRVGAGKRAPQRRRQLEADDGQYLVQPFENAGGDAGRLLVEPAGEITQASLGFVGIIELPSLSQRSAALTL
jgi:hypothetical protein